MHVCLPLGVFLSFGGGYRGTSLIRNRAPLGPYLRTMPSQGPVVVLGGGRRFLMSEEPLNPSSG